jgi:hypothetical protein
MILFLGLFSFSYIEFYLTVIDNISFWLRISSIILKHSYDWYIKSLGLHIYICAVYIKPFFNRFFSLY